MFIPRLPTPRTLTERFANIIMMARYAVAEAQLEKGLATAVAFLIDGYLQRVAKRFARLVRMAQDGTLAPPRKRKPPAEGAERPARKPRQKPLIRMGGYCWIVRRAQRAVTAGSLLRALLDDPQMRRLVGLDARFPAMLRPLLAGLATVPNPGQLPPPPPRAPRPAKPPREKPPRKPRTKKVRWWCAKPPGRGLVFSDPKLNY